MHQSYSLIERRNSVFFAKLYRLGKNNDELIQLMLANMPEDDWTTIGFCYIGPLIMGKAISEDLKHVFAPSQWLSNIVSAIQTEENHVLDQVTNGISSFLTVAQQQRITIETTTVQAIINYLEKDIAGLHKMMLLSLRTRDVNGELIPITPHGKYRFGIINPWPGAKSAESEVISRTIVAAEEAGLECIPLSNYGQVLNRETQKETGIFIRSEDLDFVITTHYESSKILDNFHYHTLWNPPEIPLNLKDYSTRITGNYLMNDDYLIYDMGGMSDHLRCILMNKPRNINDASSLTASFPESSLLKPRLDDPKMFYCGMNWERVVNNSNRHQGLFKLLDETGTIKFFGPDKVKEWGGIRPWEGYKCYQHSIPFDGFSILKEINKCGICLVLSSDIHRRAGAATNRLYEACAAGAVIISDDNPFMMKYFKDAALFITYNKKNPKDTFRQLMEKYEWIISHKKEALVLAERAQQIFCKHFTMDMQLKQIVQRHPDRIRVISRDLFSKNEEQMVAIGYVLDELNINDAKPALDAVLGNVKKQYYQNMLLMIAADESIAAEVEVYCRDRFYTTHVFPMKLFDTKQSRYMTNCEALEQMYAQIPHDLFINTTAQEVWFSDHVTTLVRTLEDEGGEVAYSARARICPDHMIFPEFFDKIQPEATLIKMKYPLWMPYPGQAIFRSKCHTYLPAYMHPFLDGCEHIAMIVVSWLIKGNNPAFSKRMTYQYKEIVNNNRPGMSTVLSMDYQQRLIMDMIHYLQPVGATYGETVNMNEIMYGIAWLPMKKWASLKGYRILTRLLPKSSQMHAKMQKKYNDIETSFLNHFDG